MKLPDLPPPGLRVMTPAQRIALRRALYLLQNGKCWICGEDMELPRRKRPARDLARMATLDHIIPLRECGRDTPGNILLAHAACNQARDGQDQPQVDACGAAGAQ